MGAGLGSRLRPLTESRPKPLVPIFTKPLITFALDHLLSVGIERFVINTHHLADRWTEFFPSSTYRGAPIDFVFEPELLETGGGIANAADRIGDEPFLVYSGDVLTNLDLSRLIEAHFRGGHDVTLGLRETGLSTAIACREGRVVDFKGRYGEEGRYDFANVSVWTKAAVDWLPPIGEKAPFIPILVDRLGEGGQVGGEVLNENEWFNVGTRDEYLRVHRVIAETDWRPKYLSSGVEWPVHVHSGATVAESAEVAGNCVVGSRSKIGDGAVLDECIVWDGATVEADSRLERCIIRDFQVATGAHCGEDI